MENAALPVLSSVDVPSVVGGLVFVSLNCTIPVGTIEPEEGITVTVNVTGLPPVDGFCDDVIVVEEPTTAKADSPIGAINENDNRIQTNGTRNIFIIQSLAILFITNTQDSSVRIIRKVKVS